MIPISSQQMNPQGSTDDANYDSPGSQVAPNSPTVTNDTNDRDYAIALAESREEFNMNFIAPSTKARDPYNARKEDRDPPMSNMFAPLTTPDADTLIYIGPPPKAPDQSKADYEYIVQCFSNLHRVGSQTLRDLGSSAFERLLGPKSERTRRRFGKEGLLTGLKIENIKYYIDLRPAEEGDEAVELITDLTCTQGILTWYRAEKKYLITPKIICGRDDCLSPLDQFRVAEARKNADPPEKESTLKPEAEYSALRHRSAIERVLQAIYHKDPKLDSAPKLWNFFQVAKHLDVAKHERISGWITKWLYSPPNFNFIQSNPEVVYRIGMGTMSTNMICDALSMLAGEKALLDASDPTLRLNLKTSVHGRPLEILDDDERNRIDHAAVSLHACMKARFEYLTDQNMDWLKQSKEYSKLHKLASTNIEEKEAILTADKNIKDYVRGRIMWVLARNYMSDHSEFDHSMLSCRYFREGLPMYFNEIYNNMSEEQRLLTRTFWISLQSERFETGHCNVWTPSKGVNGVLHLQIQGIPDSDIDHCPMGTEMAAREKRQPGTGVRKLFEADLARSINVLNDIRVRHWSEINNIDYTVARKRPSPSEKQVAKPLDPQIGSSTAQGKHNLIEIDSEDDASLTMIGISRPRSGSDKRRRLSGDTAATTKLAESLAGESTTLPLRVRDRNQTEDGAAVDEVLQSQRAPFWEKAKRGDYRFSKKKAPSGDNEIPNLAWYDPTPVPSLNLDGSRISIFPDVTAIAFDTEARKGAEEMKATSWRSWGGDVYLRAESAYLVEQGEQLDGDTVWVATPEPFKFSETRGMDNKDWHEIGSLAQDWETRNLQQSLAGKEYWRATTCQLFCKSPDGSVNVVREDLVSTPTLAEASFRINDDKQFRIYIAAYDAYARHLAEILLLPYWTALNGDMYLRNPPIHMSTGADVWMLASRIFDFTHQQIRCEGSLRVEYWRAPAGDLFRRRAGRIELYTEGKEEPAPPHAGSILAAPLKIVTKNGTQTVTPYARFLDTQASDAGRNTQSLASAARKYFDAKHSTTPQSPINPKLTPSKVRYSDPPLPTLTLASENLYPYSHVLLRTMLVQFSDILSRYCSPILHPPHIYHSGDAIPRDLMDTLMCLTEDEWKYLPLWAGGNDDGTGGVFDEADVPNLEAGGFAGGKRGLGSDSVDGKGEGEGWSEIGSEAVSTVGKASKLATDGTETVKSFDTASGFMKTDELWEQIRDMKATEDRPTQLPADGQEEDQVTVRDAASDIQGAYFGDVDDDDKEVAMDEGEDEDEDGDDGFEMVDGSDDDFVPVARD